MENDKQWQDTPELPPILSCPYWQSTLSRVAVEGQFYYTPLLISDRPLDKVLSTKTLQSTTTVANDHWLMAELVSSSYCLSSSWQWAFPHLSASAAIRMGTVPRRWMIGGQLERFPWPAWLEKFAVWGNKAEWAWGSPDNVSLKCPVWWPAFFFLP